MPKLGSSLLWVNDNASDIGASGADRPRDLFVGRDVIAGTASFGSTPATLGAVRIPNAQWVAARNAANSANLNLWQANTANYLDFGTNIYRDDYGTYTESKHWIALRRDLSLAPTAGSRDSVLEVRLHSKQSGTVEQGRSAISTSVHDRSDVTNKTITGMSRLGTVVTVTATAHGYATGDSINIYGVVHTFNAEVNGAWVITNALTNTFDITVAGLSSGAYTSGGTATNRSLMYAIIAWVGPTVARGGLVGTGANGDDVNCFTAFNSGTAKGTDAYYLGRNPGIAGSEWITTFTSDANADYGIRLNGTFVNNAIDTSAGTMTSGVALRLGEGHGIQLGTVSGTKIGTTAAQKMGFYGATPVAQPTNGTDIRTVLSNLGLIQSGGGTVLGVPTQASGTVTNTTAFSATSTINVSSSFIAGTSIQPTFVPTVAALTQQYALQMVARIGDNAGTSNSIVGPIHGLWTRFDTTATYTGTVTSARGMTIANPSKNGGSATITTYYGLYIDTLNAAGANYAIYVEGGNTTYLGGGAILNSALTWATDNTADIGAVGASRPRDLFLSRNATIGGTLAAGATALAGNLTFTDATYDIGASGATRPRDLWLSRNASVLGTLASGPQTVTGGTVTTDTPTMTGAQTWNAAGVTFTGLRQNITDTASAGQSLLADLQVGGVSKFEVDKFGNAYAAGVVDDEHPEKLWETVTNATTTLTSFGIPTRTVTSPTAATNQANWRNHWLRISAATLNGIAKLEGVFTVARVDWDPVFSTEIEIPTITSVRIYIGLTSATFPAAETLATISAAAFRFSTGSTDTVWQCVTSNGAAQTVTASGVTVAASTRYRLKIDASDAANIRFYINGALVATNTATLPAVATPLGPVHHLTALVAAQRDLHYAWMRLELV